MPQNGEWDAAKQRPEGEGQMARIKFFWWESPERQRLLAPEACMRPEAA
jgi:hypothetical protein